MHDRELDVGNYIEDIKDTVIVKGYEILKLKPVYNILYIHWNSIENVIFL